MRPDSSKALTLYKSCTYLLRKMERGTWRAPFYYFVCVFAACRKDRVASDLVDELLSAGSDAVSVSFKHSPSLRRKDLVDGRLVHERLLVPEETDDVLNELTSVVWRRLVETTDSLLEQDAPDRYDQSHTREMARGGSRGGSLGSDEPPHRQEML